jgi:predicted small secreted protein
MKTIAKLFLLGLVSASLSSCLVTTTGLGLQVCYDKACVGVQVPPTQTAVNGQPAPQRLMVKDAGK